MKGMVFFSSASFKAGRIKEWGWYLSLVAILLLGAWLSRGFGWEVVLQAAPFLLRGIATSWILTLTSVSIGMVVAILLAAARMYGFAGVRHIAVAFIEIMRAIPQLMIIFWVYFTSPAMTGQQIQPWKAAVISLSIIAAAYLAETIRAGLISVPRVQIENAYVTGLNSRQTFMFIILPQALRNMLPGLIAQVVMLFKTTSLVYVIGLHDFFRAVVLVNNREFAPYALYTTMAIGYFLCCFTLALTIRRIDPKYDLAST